MDAGERWTLNDVAGKPFMGWDSRNHQCRYAYDAARRPAGLFVQTGSSPEQFAENTVYGEGQPSASQDQAMNLRGKVYQQFDGAGVVTNYQYDFKGNLLNSSRELLNDYKDPVDWSTSPSLTGEVLTSSSTFDALNRPVTMVAPDSSVIRRPITRHRCWSRSTSISAVPRQQRRSSPISTTMPKASAS